MRAKAPEGSVPFNSTGRQLAGLGDDFIQNLQIYQRSRGRTPNLHFFNPNCESHVAAAIKGESFLANKAATHLEEDLEALLFANALPDDVALFRVPPSAEHLTTLRAAGLTLPEIIPLQKEQTIAELATRKLGGFRPWAWSPEASELFQPLAQNPTQNTLYPWQHASPPAFFEKSLTAKASAQLQLSQNESFVLQTKEEAIEFIDHMRPQGPLLLKPLFACAGRGQLVVDTTTPEKELTNWLTRNLQAQGSVVVEAYLSRLLDFSALYDVTRNGEVRFVAFTRLITDSRGHYQGTRVAPKIGNLFPHDSTVFFHQPVIEAEGKLHTGPDFYKKVLPASFSNLLPNYSGPVAVDAFFYQSSATEVQIRPVVEINARCSMGRIAHNLRRRLAPNSVGELRIHRLKNGTNPTPAGLPLNDPQQAKSFLAIWSLATS